LPLRPNLNVIFTVNPSPSAAHVCARSLLGSFGLVLLGLLCPVAGHTRDSESKVEITVRAEVERPFRGLGRAPIKEHGKIYQIASIQLVPSNPPLVRPVDDRFVLEALQKELTRRGFTAATDDQPPEIILTVIYGRGWLRNPYFDDVMIAESTNPPTVISHGMPTNMARQKSFSHESKLLAAQAEKLFLYVSAWANPADTAPTDKRGKKPKPRRLWKTNMIVDDPSNRDLNDFIEEMLAAGSAYFDRQIDSEEVTVRSSIPEGRVILAPLHFADDDRNGAPTSREKK